MHDIPLGSTSVFPFLMVDALDHITGKTGLTPTVKISKNGAAGASPVGAVAEIDATNMPGWYKLTPDPADTGTLGALLLHASAAGADPVDQEWQVVAYNPGDAAGLGLTRLDAAMSSRAATGAAMTLTGGERTSIAAAVEAALLNEGDGSAVQQALVDKINATDTNLAGLTLSAIAQAVRDVAIAGAAANSLGALVSSIYARLGAPAGASMSADIALLLVDLLLVKAKTDQLTYTKTGEVDANAQSMNDAPILGNGTPGNLWRG